MKGFRAKKVAVPGVRTSDLFGDDPSDNVDDSEIEPEKEKTPKTVSFPNNIRLLD